MYYNNINGYTSKKDSLEEIVKTVQPDLIALCETKLGEKEEVDIEGYETLAHNVKKGQEGLAVAARIGTYTDMESVSSEESNSVRSPGLVKILRFAFIMIRDQVISSSLGLILQL